MFGTLISAGEKSVNSLKTLPRNKYLFPSHFHDILREISLLKN